MKLSVIGTGYVGLVTGACFAEMGNTVTCMDRDTAKIEALLAGRIPFHEPGLADLVSSNQREGRLRFTASLPEAVSGSALHFIAVGTPPAGDGSADLTHVLDVAREIGCCISTDCVVVSKSTVPVGTAEQVRKVIAEELDRRGVQQRVEVVSNPEFLKEGDAVNDFMRPERVIIGAESGPAVEQMRALYAPFTRNRERLLVMGVRDAELTKYAANAMLATRISFMNEIANLCERLGVDVENVRRGIGSDSRIGNSFLYPGCGYGGSCFPKDLRALVHMAEENGVVPEVLKAVVSRNQSQRQRLFEKIRERFGAKLAVSTIAVWGLAFKPGTDDVREAPSLMLIERLIGAGARVQAYDPIAIESVRRSVPADWLSGGKLALVAKQDDAVARADALALVTEWKSFRNPDFELIRKLMRTPVIFDGRNQYDPERVRGLGFEYFGIGR
ncbi:MAG TPA: UDP-glucose/GDP-mannose dehydrogenase family protein [Pseudomonadales bacterium]